MRTELVSDPLSVVDRLFTAELAAAADRTLAAKNAVKVISRHFAAEAAGVDVPSLNDAERDRLVDGTLVRFRGMVQDTFESEIFVGALSKTTTTPICGLFRDSISGPEGWNLDLESRDNVLLDRQSLYLVPIPAETAWAKSLGRTEEEIMEAEPSTSSSDASRTKRGVDDDEESTTAKRIKPDDAAAAAAERRGGDGRGSGSSAPFDLNFPLTGEKGPAVIAKVYDADAVGLKVCDVCEFLGILSFDSPQDPPPFSSLSSLSSLSSTDPSDSSTPMDFSSPDFDAPPSPPSSLVPRLHVLVVHKLSVDDAATPERLRLLDDADLRRALAEELKATPPDAGRTLRTMLTSLLMGDELAAKYLACHLVSSVYSRRDVRPIGQMSLNFSNAPPGHPLPKRIAQVLALLRPAVDLLPMSLEVLNGPSFVPVKDYEANRLVSGRLQLARGTEILADETLLSAGRLDERGVRNLAALGNVVRWQKVDYDFKWNSQEIPTDLRFVVVSEGKSILPADFHVPLRPSTGVVAPAEEYDRLLDEKISSLSPSLLASLRLFLSLLRRVSYEVDEETQRLVEEDFVAARAADRQSMTVEDFERLLLLARYSTLLDAASAAAAAESAAAGKVSLSLETWNECRRMEEERKGRIPEPRMEGGGDEGRVGVEM